MSMTPVGGRPAPSARGPFAAFKDELPEMPPLRAVIVAACYRRESECLPPLLDLAQLSADASARVASIARRLVERLRAKPRSGGVEGLLQEYALSSQEGVALMCLAEALLRIPDTATRDALIRDKISSGDWRQHVGHSSSLFVNAATWGLVVSGKLTSTTSETSLSSALTRLIARSGEPLIRKGTDLAMRMMGEQFVSGQTIAEALRNAQRMERQGFHYSYDMLGEAATTPADAARYLAEYQGAIHAIGQAANGRGIYEGPGISIKLSALHPRYVRAKRRRVLEELAPRVHGLALLARRYDIGLNIDAEEASRLDLSLDILEGLATDPALAGWNGLGFVIQAYGKRCPFVVDFLVDLGRRTRRRLMVRLVKGAYWDSEIKRAQIDGLDDYPVFTRKVYTDVSYLACARKLLAAPDAIFPQFATHNAQTLASIIEMAGANFYPDQYEFQCLHGMGEPLYEEVVGVGKLDRPCRIYAPVGTHETLLAYLVRRLLENGANSSFVNQIADASVPVSDLIADPAAVVRAMPVPGAPHPKIERPCGLYGAVRANSRGLDLGDEAVLATLADALEASAALAWTAVPSGCDPASATEPVRNPADHADLVGHARSARPIEIESALSFAARAAEGWGSTAPSHRAAMLRRAADAFEARMPILLGLIVREAGKSLANAVAEVREAVDFLRYYAAEAERILQARVNAPLGPVACISPWNFPLAIFTGQVAAALAAGNTVLAKPAEETPLIAAEAVRLIVTAGVPDHALQLVPGAGDVGASLVADARVQGVVFTGSTAVGRLIQRQLAKRLSPQGRPIPLIAETGGQNALIVDSSALAEQVVADVLASAFDSAGQRCSALRILCLQEEIADRTLSMLQGAMAELDTGDNRRLAVDVGPVITQEAANTITRHVETMRGRGCRITQAPVSSETTNGSFVCPTIIEIDRIADVGCEVFGPVLHVLRFRREELDDLIDDLNATGYGLTFGIHTRLDETIERVVERVQVGNIYVNRNIVGAIVGVQPFGGSGLSGTGPKAGGPLYLGRLLQSVPDTALSGLERPEPLFAAADMYVDCLRAHGRDSEAARVRTYIARSPLGAEILLPGPVGERNVYRLRSRGPIAAISATARGLLLQVGAILATGNTARVMHDGPAIAMIAKLPPDLAVKVAVAERGDGFTNIQAILFEGEHAALRTLNRDVAELEDSPILSIQALSAETLAGGEDYELAYLLKECSISINTTAAGGNASLMTLT